LCSLLYFVVVVVFFVVSFDKFCFVKLKIKRQIKRAYASFSKLSDQGKSKKAERLFGKVNH